MESNRFPTPHLLIPSPQLDVAWDNKFIFQRSEICHISIVIFEPEIRCRVGNITIRGSSVHGVCKHRGVLSVTCFFGDLLVHSCHLAISVPLIEVWLPRIFLSTDLPFRSIWFQFQAFSIRCAHAWSEVPLLMKI
jgi:hypothetical protein